MQNVMLVALAAVVCGACKDEPAPAPPVDGLVLVSAGAEPRRAMRYAIAAQQTSALELALDLDLRLGDRGGPMPTLVMTVEHAADEVAPDGSATMRTVIRAATARDRAGAVLPTATLATQAAHMVGTTLRTRITPDGQITSVRGSAADAAPASVDTLVASLRQNLEGLAMPLPAQPIGAGAKWRYRKTLELGGAQLVATTQVDVLAVDARTLTFTAATELTGADQQATRDGVTVALRKIAGRGTGKGTIDLSRMTMIGERAMTLHMDMARDATTPPTPLDMAVAMRVTQGAQSAP